MSSLLEEQNGTPLLTLNSVTIFADRLGQDLRGEVVGIDPERA
jgi:hypothetical protein